MTAVEATTALPYLGALAAMAEAELTVPAMIFLLVVYNVVFVAPPIALGWVIRRAGPGALDRLRTGRVGGSFRTPWGRRVPRLACGAVGVIPFISSLVGAIDVA